MIKIFWRSSIIRIEPLLVESNNKLLSIFIPVINSSLSIDDSSLNNISSKVISIFSNLFSSFNSQKEIKLNEQVINFSFVLL